MLLLLLLLLALLLLLILLFLPLLSPLAPPLPAEISLTDTLLTIEKTDRTLLFWLRCF